MLRGVPLPFELGGGDGAAGGVWLGRGRLLWLVRRSCGGEGLGRRFTTARELPGGLNTYGIAEYKLTLGASLQEVELIRGLGVEFRMGVSVDAVHSGEELERTGHDAVFLGIGLGGIHRLGLAGEELSGVVSALDLIEGYKSGAVTAVEWAGGGDWGWEYGDRCGDCGGAVGGLGGDDDLSAGGGVDVGFRV